MEKLTTIIFSIFIALGMTSCAASNQTDETTITTPAATQQTSAAAENSDETSAENETSSGEGKTLVVYYSATNNTKAFTNLSPPSRILPMIWTGQTVTVVFQKNMMTNHLEMWSLKTPFPTTGKIMTRCLSDTRSGGVSPRGLLTALLRLTISREKR